MKTIVLTDEQHAVLVAVCDQAVQMTEVTCGDEYESYGLPVADVEKAVRELQGVVDAA